MFQISFRSRSRSRVDRASVNAAGGAAVRERRTKTRACVPAALLAVALLALAPPASSVDIKVTGHGGAQVDRGNGWEGAAENMVLSTCHKIRLPGSYSWLEWERIGGCGNKGRVETGLSKIKEYHVGTDIPNGNAPSTLLQGGFIDLLAGGAVTGSDAVIYEAENCFGNWHCGFNVGFAACAAMDRTPAGMQTVFSGCLAIEHDDLRVATFYNHPESPIPVYIETFANQGLHQLPPGWWAQVLPNGQVNPAPGQPPACGGEPTASVSEPWIADLAGLRAIPNPFHGSTRIFVPQNSGITHVSVHDASGRLLSRLQLEGGGSVEWTARDAQGQPLPAGVYFARAACRPGESLRSLPLIVLR